MEAVKDLFNKNYLCLFLGQLATHFGDAIIQVLLIAGIMQNVEKPGSLIALILFCLVFPSLIISPLAGSIVDRISRKKIMIWSALYRCILLLCTLLFYMFLFNKNTLPSVISTAGSVLSLLIGIGTAFSTPQKWHQFLM